MQLDVAGFEVGGEVVGGFSPCSERAVYHCHILPGLSNVPASNCHDVEATSGQFGTRRFETPTATGDRASALCT